MQEKFDGDSEDQRKTKINGTDQTIVSEEASINMMNQQVMKIFTNHDYTISQSLDYGSNMIITLKWNFVDIMIQHRTKEVYNVDNTRSLDLKLSLEKPFATSTEFLGQ